LATLIAVIALETTACAGAPRYETPESTAYAAPFRNLGLVTIRVYLEADGQVYPIGSVPALSSVRLDIPVELARHEGRFGLLLAPVVRRTLVGERVLVGNVTLRELTTRGWTVLSGRL
jgi:hypothetical protein